MDRKGKSMQLKSGTVMSATGIWHQNAELFKFTFEGRWFTAVSLGQA